MSNHYNTSDISKLYTKLYNEEVITDHLHKHGNMEISNFEKECDEKAKKYLNDIGCNESQDASKALDTFLDFLRDEHTKTLFSYSAYLERRKHEGEREMFKDHLHAKWYLLQINATKMVDGSWLQHVYKLPESPLKSILLSIYLDELGAYAFEADQEYDIKRNTNREKNHVVIWKQLLKSCFPSIEPDCPCSWVNHPFIEDPNALVDGCIQMLLARNVVNNVEEVVGYNLGYEQLPLHMLITIYELEELGISAEYFRIHVSVDNAASGHAYQAENAVKVLLKTTKECDRLEVMKRVLKGFYMSNMYCKNILESYDLNKLIDRILRIKAELYTSLHDTVLLEGTSYILEDDEMDLGKVMRLAVANETVSLGDVLWKHGFLTENDVDFESSRFGKTLTPSGAMYGVFTAEELEYLDAWFSEKVKSFKQVSYTPCKFELSEEDIKLIDLYRKDNMKHKKIMMSHPVTGKIDTMSNWYTSDPTEFYRCLSEPKFKEMTKASFLCGKMQKVKYSDEIRQFIYDWCDKPSNFDNNVNNVNNGD